MWNICPLNTFHEKIICNFCWPKNKIKIHKSTWNEQEITNATLAQSSESWCIFQNPDISVRLWTLMGIIVWFSSGFLRPPSIVPRLHQSSYWPKAYWSGLYSQIEAKIKSGEGNFKWTTFYFTHFLPMLNSWSHGNQLFPYFWVHYNFTLWSHLQGTWKNHVPWIVNQKSHIALQRDGVVREHYQGSYWFSVLVLLVHVITLRHTAQHYDFPAHRYTLGIKTKTIMRGQTAKLLWTT